MKKKYFVTIVGLIAVVSFGVFWKINSKQNTVKPVFEEGEKLIFDAYQMGELDPHDYFTVDDGTKVNLAVFNLDNNLYNQEQDAKLIVKTDYVTKKFSYKVIIQDDVYPTVVLKEGITEIPQVITVDNVKEYFDIYDMNGDEVVAIRQSKEDKELPGVPGYILSGNGKGVTEFVSFHDDTITAFTISAWDGHGNRTTKTFKFLGQTLIQTGVD